MSEDFKKEGTYQGVKFSATSNKEKICLTERKDSANTTLTQKHSRSTENTRRRRTGKENQQKSLQTLEDCPQQQIEGLFISKVRLCAKVYSPRDVYIGKSKIKTLQELTDYIDDHSIIPLSAYSEIVSLFSANVFRTLPPSSVPQTYEIDSDEEDILQVYNEDKEWQCLEKVYHFFLAFLDCINFDPSACKPYITQKFIVSLLPIFDSENPHERYNLRSVLHRVYQLFLALRPYIRKQISYIFQTFVYETEQHNGISDLLEVVISIVAGLMVPLKEEHKIFLKKCLLPLHIPSSFPRYSSTLAYIVSRYLEKDPSLTQPVINALLKYWPKGNSAKELLFLIEFEEFLRLSPDTLKEMKKLKAPILRQLMACSSSSHIQISEKALTILESKETRFLIAPCNK